MDLPRLLSFRGRNNGMESGHGRSKEGDCRSGVGSQSFEPILKFASLERVGCLGRVSVR